MANLTAVNTHILNDTLPFTDWNILANDVNYITSPGATLASASTLVITNEFHQVSGSVTINTISHPAPVAGQQVRLMFQATCIINDTGVAGGNITLLGSRTAVNRSFSTPQLAVGAGAILTLMYDGGSWRESGDNTDPGTYITGTFSQRGTDTPSHLTAMVSNTAYLSPVIMRRGFPVTLVQVEVSNSLNQGGNFDVGLYDKNFNRVLSTGSTVVGSPSWFAYSFQASATAFVGGVSVACPSGLYYVAIAVSAATWNLKTYGTLNWAAVAANAGAGAATYTKASSLPLPASLSGLTQGNDYMSCLVSR